MSYIDSYYARTVADQRKRSALEETHTAEICILGAGYAGLTTALELAKGGKSVVLLEAEQIGWGASGRNGGFVSPGYAVGEAQIAKKLGKQDAQRLHKMSIEGMELVRNNIEQYEIPSAKPVSGITGVTRYDSGDDLKIAAAESLRDYNYPLEFLDRDDVQARLMSSCYHQGLRDQNAFHIHPLNYARGLANAVEAHGGVIFENSAALRVEKLATQMVVHTAKGKIKAEKVVVTTGGYTGSLLPKLKRAFLPIATYVLITEEAPDLLAQVIKTTDAIGDDRRAADYYRLVDDGKRLMWGGRITTIPAKPADVATILRKEMVGTYPELSNLKVELAWSGLMAYARHQMPQIGKLGEQIWHCTAFGGHGLNTTAIGSKVVAEALLDQTDRYELFAPFGLAWTGGPVGKAAAQMTYWGLQAMDWWKERG